jgi:hypothetical protein
MTKYFFSLFFGLQYVKITPQRKKPIKTQMRKVMFIEQAYYIDQNIVFKNHIMHFVQFFLSHDEFSKPY